jgi:hypothetical protein
MRLNILSTASALIISGRSSTELNYNTLDIASTTDSLLTRQVLYNLSNFLDSDIALPAQIVISSGTTTTADTVGATATAPLSKSLTTTAQGVSTIAAPAAKTPPSVAITNSVMGVRAGTSLSATGQDVRSQNYSFTLITDSNQMWRLKALYRFAIDGDERKFVEDYPLIYKTVSQQRNVCLRDKSRNNAIVYGTATTADANSGLPSEPFKSCLTTVGGMGVPTMT